MQFLRNFDHVCCESQTLCYRLRRDMTICRVSYLPMTQIGLSYLSGKYKEWSDSKEALQNGREMPRNSEAELPLLYPLSFQHNFWHKHSFPVSMLHAVRGNICMLYSSILLIYSLFFKATVERKDRSVVVSVKSFVMIVNSCAQKTVNLI